MTNVLLALTLTLISFVDVEAQEISCTCNFDFDVSGLKSIAELRLSRFRFTGEGFNRRSIDMYASQTKFIRGMSVEPTASWYAENSACGTKKFCVTKVRFLDEDLDTSLQGAVTMIVELKRRE